MAALKKIQPNFILRKYQSGSLKSFKLLQIHNHYQPCQRSRSHTTDLLLKRQSVPEEDARWLKMLLSVSHIGQNLLRWEQRHAEIFSRWRLKTPLCGEVRLSRRIWGDCKPPSLPERWFLWGLVTSFTAACSQCDHFVQKQKVEVVGLHPAVGPLNWVYVQYQSYEQTSSFFFF